MIIYIDTDIQLLGTPLVQLFWSSVWNHTWDNCKKYFNAKYHAYKANVSIYLFRDIILTPKLSANKITTQASNETNDKSEKGFTRCLSNNAPVDKKESGIISQGIC